MYNSHGHGHFYSRSSSGEYGYGYDVGQAGRDFLNGGMGGEKQVTQQPLVTGTSVLGLKYADGIMLAADNLASYGSLARFKDIQRLYPLYSSSAAHPGQTSQSTAGAGVLSESAPNPSNSAKTESEVMADKESKEKDPKDEKKDEKKAQSRSSHTCLAVAGDMSDFQYLKKILEGVVTKERAQSTTDAHPALAPEQIYEYLSNVMYARRSKMNPLWNAIVLGGVKDGKSFLGYIDLLGTTYQAPTLATGFASHFAQPLLREAYEEREAAGKRGEKEGLLLSREEAEAVLDNCMKVLFYRDARSLNKYQIATITDAGIDISASRENQTEWKFAEGLRGYGPQKQ
ncbi:hypothetical protein FFLO_04158 [Filobasidium floriforme]|uniref:Proteasome subunit beta type-4 n=2 Tax=Filobasidium floriforme TaxID=5210 RepID=A0A8K0JJT1_9TREE|nr:hypothetical protein FFLO_04158 [Filobasidium floriforme]